MKRINREAIQRMVDARGGKAVGTSGGGGGSLAGYATQAWVNEGFVSIEFFNRLFTAYGPGATSSDPDVAVEPNDLDSTITNIKAMFGLWTEQYLSALGLNPGGTGSATSLSMLDDVNITTPTNGQALVYNSTTLKWENTTISTVTSLANLTDVLLTSPAANQVMIYDATNQKWVNTALKTINYQSIIGSGDISVGGGASGNYLPLTGGTVLGNTNGPVLVAGNIYGATTTTMRCSYGQGHGLFIGTSETSQSIYLFECANSITDIAGHGAVDLFVVKGDGKVGIGTSNPSFLLDIVGDAKANYFIFRNYNNNGEAGYVGRGKSASNDIVLGAYSGNGIEFKTNGSTTAAVIDTSQRVGIGTYYPSYILDVNGTAGFSDTIKIKDNSYFICGTNGFRFNNNNDAYNNFIIYDNGNTYTRGNSGVGTKSPSYTLHVVGSIYATGAITALSDIKQKNIKGYMQLGIDEVANAPVIKFTWKDPNAEDKGLQVGSIAQYWEKVLPEAVKKDKEGTLSISYGVVALVAAISTAKKVQEHERRIADLECENKKLKGQLIRLNRYG